MADATLCSGSSYSTCTNAGYTDHGYGANNGTSYWGMYQGHNCTNYVAYVLQTVNHKSPVTGLGNANNWATNASSKGFIVNNRAVKGSVAQWNSYAGGTGVDGHVAYVESVSSDGSITVSEDAYSAGPFRWRVISPGSSYWPSNFIRFGWRGPSGLIYTVDFPITGDWDGDGRTDIGVVQGNVFNLLYPDGHTGVIPFGNGPTTDIPITGNWDGVGGDEIGVVRGGTFYLRQYNGTVTTINYGNGNAAGDIPITGDWDGVGGDEIGVVQGGAFNLRSYNGSTTVILFGNSIAGGHIPIIGDWDGNGSDEPGVVGGGVFYAWRPNGAPAWTWTFGNGINGGHIPITGNWDGVGGTDAGVVYGGIFDRDIVHTQTAYGNGVYAVMP